jgi:CRP/FNR family transcriptional regulator, anaerobic regulatory protein
MIKPTPLLFVMPHKNTTCKNMDSQLLKSCIPYFGEGLINEIEQHALIKTFQNKSFVVNQGQYIRFLPIVLEGTVKIFSEENGLQFLLYYIQQGQSCIFSFVHLQNENLSEFSAIAEEESKLLLIPIEKAKEWLIKYPEFNSLIIKEFQKHYTDLLETTKQIICYKLEDRLWTYLKTKSSLTNSFTLSISHQKIADDLATNREVISRLMKKLELENKIVQDRRKINLINCDKRH